MSTSNRVSLDTDTILLRRIFAFQGSGNVPVPENGVLTTASNGIATFTNPFITLSNLDPSFTQYLPSTLYTISSQLAQAAEVSQAEFQDLSSHVSTNVSYLSSLSSTYKSFASTTNSRLDALEVSGSYATIGDLSSAIAGVNQNISTFSTQVYTDISSLSTGIRSYILTNPTGALLSTTFNAYSTAVGQNISTLSTTINNYSTFTVGLSNYTSSRISVLSGTIVELSTFIVATTGAFEGISTFSAQVYSTINNLSSTTNNNLFSTTVGIYTHPTLSNDGYITGSFAVECNTVAPAGTAFTVNTGNNFVVLDTSGQGRVGVQTAAPKSALDVSGIIKAPSITVRNTSATASVNAVQITTNGTAAQLRTGLSDLSGIMTAAGKLEITAAAGTNPAVIFDLSANSTTVKNMFEATSTSRFYFDTLFSRSSTITPTLRIDPSSQQVLIGRSVATQNSNYSLEISGVAFIPRIEINHAGGDSNVYITSNDGTNNIHGSLVWGNNNIDATSRRFSFRAGATRDVMVLDDTGCVGINQYPSQAYAVDVSGKVRTNSGYYNTTSRVSIRTNTDTGLYADTSNNPGYVTLGSYDWSGATHRPTVIESPLGVLSNIAVGRKDVTSYTLDVSGTSHFGGSVVFDGSFNINNGLTVSGSSYFNPYVGIGTPATAANLTVGLSGITSTGPVTGTSRLNIQGNTYLGGVGTASIPLEVAGNSLMRGQLITSNVTQNIFASADSSDSIYFDGKKRRIYGISGTGFGNLALQVAADGSTGGFLGIGNATPSYIMDVTGLSRISNGLIINNPTGNNSTNPLIVQTAIQPFEIRGVTNPITNDAGILQLTGGGGTNTNTQSYIKLIGYNDVSDNNRSIRIGTSGTERIKIDAFGNININRTDSTNTSRLIFGPSLANSNYDYCSMIESQDLSSTDARSVLKFYTHGTASNGMPSERMRIDQIGRVGISTTDPSATFNVLGTVRFDYSGQQNVFYSPVTNNTLFVDPHASSTATYIGAGNTLTGRKNLSLQYDSTGDSTGSVGICNNNPAAKLDVSGNILATDLSIKNRTAPNAGEVRIFPTGVNNEYGNIGMNGNIQIYAAGSSLLGSVKTQFSSDAGDSYINNGGNLGINTSNPQSTLDVSGTLRLGSGSISQTAISFRDPSGAYDGDTGFYSLAQGRIGIAGNGNFIGEFNSNACLSIGKTADTAYALDVSGNGRFSNTLTVSNYIEVGIGTKTSTQAPNNTIYFAGSDGDFDATKKHTAIAERIYESTERSELLLFKGNDDLGVDGPDRVRIVSNGGFTVHTTPTNLYYSKTSGKIVNISDVEFSNDASFNLGLNIDTYGNVGIRTAAPTSYNVEVSGNVNFKGIMYNNDQSGSLIPRGAIIMWSGTSIPTGWALCDGTNGTPNLQDRFIVGSGSTYVVNASGGASSVTLSTANMPAHQHDMSDAYYIESTAVGGNLGGIIDTGFTNLGGSANTDQDNRYLYYRNTKTAYTGSGTSFSILPPYYALAFIMKT